MRFGIWRGVMVAAALVAGLGFGRSAEANNPFHHTIPREVDAIDVNTGEQYFAPPIPYGHLNKTGHLHKGVGLVTGSALGLFGKLHGVGGHGLCGLCAGKGCNSCGGSGLLGGHGGLGHGGTGHGGLGHGGLGHGSLGHGGLGHGGSGVGCLDGNCDGGGHGRRFKGCGLCGGKGCGVCSSSILPSSQTVVTAAPQGAVVTDSGCGKKGCGLGLGHRHGAGNSWSYGNGGGCGHGAGQTCGNCLGGGFGHGGGHGLGMGCGHGAGQTCGNCAGGHGLGGTGCKACGGLGCGLCKKVGSLLGTGKGLVYGLLHPHAGKIEYFVGPGGPVPITPGYVPYVNVTRSPRDFLAFPPFTP